MKESVPMKQQELCAEVLRRAQTSTLDIVDGEFTFSLTSQGVWASRTDESAANTGIPLHQTITRSISAMENWLKANPI